MTSTLVGEQNDHNALVCDTPTSSEGLNPSCSFGSIGYVVFPYSQNVLNSMCVMPYTPSWVDSLVVTTLPLQGRDRKFKSFSTHCSLASWSYISDGAIWCSNLLVSCSKGWVGTTQPYLSCWLTSTPVHSREVHNGNRKLATVGRLPVVGQVQRQHKRSVRSDDCTSSEIIVDLDNPHLITRSSSQGQAVGMYGA